MPPYVQWTRPAGGSAAGDAPGRPALDEPVPSRWPGFRLHPGEVFLTEPDGKRHFRCALAVAVELIRERRGDLGRSAAERIGLGARRISRPADWVHWFKEAAMALTLALLPTCSPCAAWMGCRDSNGRWGRDFCSITRTRDELSIVCWQRSVRLASG